MQDELPETPEHSKTPSMFPVERVELGRGAGARMERNATPAGPNGEVPGAWMETSWNPPAWFLSTLCGVTLLFPIIYKLARGLDAARCPLAIFAFPEGRDDI